MSGPRESLVSGRLLLAFASALLVTGITNAFPVFFPPLLAEFGGSRAATASTITLIWVGGAVLGPISGWTVARWNPRASVSLGLLSAALGFALGSVSHSLTLFRLAVGVGVGHRRGIDRDGHAGRAAGGCLRRAARRGHGDRLRRRDGRLRSRAPVPVGDHALRLARGARGLCGSGGGADPSRLDRAAIAAQRRPTGQPPPPPATARACARSSARRRSGSCSSS